MIVLTLNGIIVFSSRGMDLRNQEILNQGQNG